MEGESLLGLSALKLTFRSAHSSLNLTTTPRYMENFIREFPLIAIGVHITKISHGKKKYREILCKIFRILKFEIEFHSQKKVVSPNLENCAHLFILNYMFAKFQQH